MKPLVLCVAALTLAGCQTTQTAPTPISAAPIDAKIAEVSAELAKQCALLATGIVLGQAFATKPEALKTLKVAEAARREFCASPPVDTASAIQTVAAMALAVNSALKEQPL